MPASTIETWLPLLMTGQANAMTLSQLPRLEEYRLNKLLGRGGMGCVYAAHDTLLDRPVAIKFLSTIEPGARDRFLIEARAIARLTHPNVVSIHRVGAIGEVPFLVSEYVRGKSLDRLQSPLPSDEVLRIGIDLARGLSAAHRCGVLHRDIKPANAIRAEDGTVKLLDFGLAKLSVGYTQADLPSEPPILETDALDRTPLAATALARPVIAEIPKPTESAAVRELADAAEQSAISGLTHAGAQLGTPLYMAPEMWRGEPATSAVDIYSLGALLFDLAAGRPPHSAPTIDELVYQVTMTDAPSLSSVAANVDGGLASVIDRCVRRDPEARFASADALVEALEQLRDQKKGIAPKPAASLAWRILPFVAVPGLLLFAGLRYAERGRGRQIQKGQGAPWVDPIDEAAVAARTPVGMAFIPGRSFAMGATTEAIEAAFAECPKFSKRCEREYFEWAQPVRKVTVSPFYLDKHEVTNQDFAAWLNLSLQPLSLRSERLVYSGETLLCDLHPMASRIELRDKRYVAREGYANHPVLQVSWYGAQQYCQAHGKTLPTEAQWELAARAATLPQNPRRHSWPWGEESPRCDGVTMARDADESCAQLPRSASPVGTSAQDVTPQGIYDLGGNAREWVFDRFLGRYPDCGSCIDPVVTDSPGEASVGGATFRVVRGGNYLWSAQAAYSTERTRWREDLVATGTGFRCAMPITR